MKKNTPAQIISRFLIKSKLFLKSYKTRNKYAIGEQEKYSKLYIAIGIIIILIVGYYLFAPEKEPTAVIQTESEPIVTEAQQPEQIHYREGNFSNQCLMDVKHQEDQITDINDLINKYKDEIEDKQRRMEKLAKEIADLEYEREKEEKNLKSIKDRCEAEIDK